MLPLSLGSELMGLCGAGLVRLTFSAPVGILGIGFGPRLQASSLQLQQELGSSSSFGRVTVGSW